MKQFKLSRNEKMLMIKGYLKQGLSQSEIARLLEISRQLVRYWVKEIRKKGKNKK